MSDYETGGSSPPAGPGSSPAALMAVAGSALHQTGPPAPKGEAVICNGAGLSFFFFAPESSFLRNHDSLTASTKLKEGRSEAGARVPPAQAEGRQHNAEVGGGQQRPGLE